MANKMTKMQKFEMLSQIPAIAENPILAEFVEREMELLAKKNSGEKKLTVQQTENQKIKSLILLAMEPGEKYTVTELAKRVPECAEFSNQRMNAIVKQLKDAGLIVRIEEKRKAYFQLVE